MFALFGQWQPQPHKLSTSRSIEITWGDHHRKWLFGLKICVTNCKTKIHNTDKDFCLSSTALKLGHRYYTQVQEHMLVLGVDLCEFVVWTPKCVIVTTVESDKEYQMDITNRMSRFFRQCILPEQMWPHKAHPLVLLLPAAWDGRCRGDGRLWQCQMSIQMVSFDMPEEEKTPTIVSWHCKDCKKLGFRSK